MIRVLDPAFLMGLAAIAVPIILHLLLRRRVPVVLFPLTRLLERAERTRQARRHLNRILLLVARSLLLALLAFALARLTIGSSGVVAASGPQALVVILDDSLSMGALDSSKRRAFDVAVEAADDLFASLPDGSLSALILASAPETTEGLAPDAALARKDLERARLTSRHVTFGPALREGLRLLATAPLPDRRIVLICDLARHGFAGIDLDPIEGAPPVLDVLPPSRRDDRTNRSVSGLSTQQLPDGRLAVLPRVAAWGGPATDVPLEVRIGAAGGALRVADRAKVSPRGGASAERRFELSSPREGYVVIEAAAGEDFLPGDDVRVAVHHVARRPRVLVVDGDPQNVSLGSETFYLEKALARDVGLDFDAEVLTLAELEPKDLAGRDAIVVCNAPELNAERTEALEAAVSAGTGLVVALGNRVDQRTYNGRLATLLPATLALPRQLDPPLGIVGDAPLPDLPRVGVSSHVGLAPDDSATVLARLSDGAPLLVAGRLGAGTVLLFGTTLDRDWTDLPISPHFLALVRHVVDRVASRQEGRVLDTVPVGQPMDLADVAPGAELVVVQPDGSRVDVRPGEPFARTDQPGAHLVESQGKVLAAFAVVTDAAESDLSRAPDEIAGLVAPALVVRGRVAAGEAAAAGSGWPAWKALLLALVAVAMAEAWLARRAA